MAELDDVADMIADRLRQVNTAMPGRIAKYNASTREAEVEPLIKEKYADGQILKLPNISGVPVMMPATSGAGVVMPIAAGDDVLLLFAQRSIDRWLTSGGVQESADKRMLALSDAIAIPGLFSFDVTHSDGDGAGVRIFNEDDEVRLESGASALLATIKTQADGKIAAGTATVELLDEITKAFDEIAIGLAAIPSANAATLAASVALKLIKGTI